MKNVSFNIFNIFAISTIIMLIVLILIPFNLINMEQAQRTAKWLNVYEKLNYSFNLVRLHEGSIIPSQNEAEKVISDEYILQRLLPYFNAAEEELEEIPNYSYRKMNGSLIKKTNQFFFNKFIKTKDGVLLSLKKSKSPITNKKQALYYMFIDINGIEKPNRIGQDIFFINIYKDNISALGSDKTKQKLKTNCSPIGSGFYCSEFYLLGGSF